MVIHAGKGDGSCSPIHGKDTKLWNAGAGSNELNGLSIYLIFYFKNSR